MNTDRMVPDAPPVGAALPASIEIASVTGGKKPTFGGSESVTNQEFEEALVEALRASDRISADGETADLQMTASILHQSQKTTMGSRYTGYLTVNYSIHDAANGTPLWHRHIRSSFEASAFSGAKRTVLAREGAVRQNLALLMTALATWDGSDAVLTSSELVAGLSNYSVGSTNIERFNKDFGRVGGATRRDYLFPDDIRLQRRSWSVSNNGMIDAELVFLRAPDEQDSDLRIPVALLVFEHSILSERFGPSMSADNYLADISDALQARELSNQQEQAASLNQQTTSIMETRESASQQEQPVSLERYTSGEYSVLVPEHGFAVVRSGMTGAEVAGALRDGNVPYQPLTEDIWLVGDTLLIFENNKLTKHSY